MIRELRFVDTVNSLAISSLRSDNTLLIAMGDNDHDESVSYQEILISKEDAVELIDWITKQIKKTE